MRIESLKLKDFRNYEKLSLILDPVTNIFYGNNAQGKTNILESVYIAGTTRSHRNAKDKDVIRFEREEAHIEINLRKKDIPYCIDMHLKKNKSKGVAVNKYPISRVGELFGILNLVFFSPEDLDIIKRSPGERRNFINMELCQIDKIYLHDLNEYHKILNQRNKLLKDLEYSKELIDTLDIWDLQLIEYGNRIIRRRQDFICELNEIVRKIHEKLSGKQEQLEILYEANTGNHFMEDEVRKYRDRDIHLKTTTIGPHRDDLKFTTNGIDLRYYGSQGQQRTAALSLKLSEISFVKDQIKDTPVLLLDDVLSELDQNRQEYLLDSIHDIQTLITCTGLNEFVNHRFNINKIFRVENGNVIMEN